MSFEKMVEEVKSLSKDELLEYFKELQRAVKQEYDLKKIVNEALNDSSEEIHERRFDFFKGEMSMTEDFDKPLVDFNEYM